MTHQTTGARRADIGIIGAMNIEIEALRAAMTDVVAETVDQPY